MSEKQVKKNVSDTKTSRRMRDYHVPRLTFAEAARVLRVEIGVLKIWLMETLEPSPARWSKWVHDQEELPEPIIRKFLESPAKNDGGAQAHAPPGPLPSPKSSM